MNLFKKYIALTACIALISACSTKSNLADLRDYNEGFKAENVNVFLKSFSDHRQGRELLKPTGSDILYAYDPQSVTSGQMLPLLGYYLYNALDFQDEQADRQLGIDVSLRKVTTAVRHGHIPTTRLGYYFVEVQARVIVRDIKNNEIVEVFPIVVSDKKIRSTSTGRAPSDKEDNYAILKLIDNTSIKLADEVLDRAEEIIEDLNEELAIIEEYNDGEQPNDFVVMDVDQVDETSPIVEKANTVKINQIKSEDLGTTKTMEKSLAEEEKKLLARKALQRKLFEQKIQDQKYLDFLDSNQ